ncbi:hypothetical protein [Anaerotruncus colihominis]|uniref:Uncharacterized protein n=1 Tax=Anaerotruncus colihominis TaxID=169435 RepID=A0A845T0G9_9FIRM|nr:hypothetical protein [Anaerotruncus colihominis]MCR2026894.1 hypothetical protein [Anaerotruncus colihominis]NDO40354.1 hypothetical protein [Anaerotruncus colihominis]
MKKVKIINGVYGARDNKTSRVTPVSIGGTVEVSDEEAARLVGFKVAAYVDEASPANGVATPPVTIPIGGAGKDAPDGEDSAEGQENGCGDDEALDIVDGHFTVESLMALERKDMDTLAADLSIEAAAIKKCKNKTELAELIAAVEIDEGNTGDGEQPPTLGTEGPVE